VLGLPGHGSEVAFSMGRTVKPFSLVLADQQAVWSRFKRHLEPQDRRALEAIFEASRLHNYAAVYASFLDPVWPEMLSILIERQKRMTDLINRAEAIKNRIDRLMEGN
jgi:hypothetical protein